jgi:hypothetical protein
MNRGGFQKNPYSASGILDFSGSIRSIGFGFLAFVAIQAPSH